MELQKKKKSYYLCCMPLQNCLLFAKSKAVNMRYDKRLSETKHQLRKEVIKIALLFKLHVNNTGSTMHNEINKINFVRLENYF